LRYRKNVLALYFLFLSLILGSPSGAADDRLQRALNEAISKRQGAALVLEVETGQILASYRMDVAARRVASPGSTVKPFTLMALLDAGLVTEKTALICPLTTRIGGRKLDCSHAAGLGPIDPVMALAYSCNHFFIRNSEHLPMDSLYRAFSRAGFNSLTGKWRSEIAGTVQQPGSKEAMQLMSIGEDSVGVTPLALAEAYRALAQRLRTPQALTTELRLVAEGLESAVKVGTGQLAASKEMRVAGKTGTAGGHAWFAGFAPAEWPEIVVVVFLERGRGGSDAAPIAGRIFAGYSVSRTEK
jgi:penicillin-binding protein 2